MEIKINTVKMIGGASDGMEEAALSRLSKIEEFLNKDEPVKLKVETIKHNKIHVSVQVVLLDNHHLKMDTVDEDFYTALYTLEDDLKRAIRKHREKYLSKRNKKVGLGKLEPANINEDIDEEGDEIPTVSKVKRFKLDSITETMAITEMEQMGHDHYIFKNANEDDKTCMLYKRMDGDYGLIITE